MANTFLQYVPAVHYGVRWIHDLFYGGGTAIHNNDSYFLLLLLPRLSFFIIIMVVVLSTKGRDKDPMMLIQRHAKVRAVATR